MTELDCHDSYVGSTQTVEEADHPAMWTHPHSSQPVQIGQDKRIKTKP